MTGPTGPDGELPPGEIHDVLRNDRRRLVLGRLREGAGAETVSDLAEHIGSIETGESPPPRNVRQSVYVSLHQTHLPKLDDLGIVAYDSDGKTVELAARASDLDAYLEVGSDDTGEPAIFLALGLLGATALLATIAGVPGLRAVGPAAVGLAVSGLVIGVATVRLLADGGTVGLAAGDVRGVTATVTFPAVSRRAPGFSAQRSPAGGKREAGRPERVDTPRHTRRECNYPTPDQ